jgi:predicted esterase YcpF (UPF0227 family)
MDRPLILYLHGFCSSPASLKSRQLGEYMSERGLGDRFVCPPLSPVPDVAVATASRLIAGADGPVTLVGSSLGGHYANYLAEKHGLKAVLINPAAVHCLDAGKFIGEHANFHTGERFTFSAAHAAQLAAQVSKPTPSRYWLLSEMGDEVLDWRQATAFYCGCRQTVLPGGDHSFTRFPDFMPQILEFAGL